MLLSKAVENFYKRQVQILSEKCPGCGVYLTRIEQEEYGRCWLCEQEAKKDGRDS